MIELLIGVVLAAIIMAAAYQTMRLNWRSLSGQSRIADLETEAKRASEIIARDVRELGYNPLNTPYDTGSTLTTRIGLVVAASDYFIFSKDVRSEDSDLPDGIIATATTLDSNLLPVEGKTDGREIAGYRLGDGKLWRYVVLGQSGRWQVLVDHVSRFRIQYRNGKGELIKTPKPVKAVETLREIRSLQFTITLSRPDRTQVVTAENVTTIALRNPPFLTASDSP